MKKSVKVLFALVSVTAIFMMGFLYNELIYHANILCGPEFPARLNRSLPYKGVVIQQGAVISLRECMYSTSFSITFDLPHAPLVGDDSPLQASDIEFLSGKDIDRSEYAGAISDFSAWQER